MKIQLLVTVEMGPDAEIEAAAAPASVPSVVAAAVQYLLRAQIEATRRIVPQFTVTSLTVEPAQIAAAELQLLRTRMWCLISNLKGRKKTAFDLAHLVGAGSTTAHRLWEAYGDMLATLPLDVMADAEIAMRLSALEAAEEHEPLGDTAKRLLQAHAMGIRLYQQDGHRYIQWLSSGQVDWYGLYLTKSGTGAGPPEKEYGSLFDLLNQVDEVLTVCGFDTLLGEFRKTWGDGGWKLAWGLAGDHIANPGDAAAGGVTRAMMQEAAVLLTNPPAENENHATELPGPVVDPTAGGCWYCHRKTDGTVFSTEFDTYVHLDCLRAAFKADPNDSEAQIMGRELLSDEEQETIEASRPKEPS